MLSKQEIFNEAYIKVIKQGERCATGGHCLYFNEENGHMCAAGHVMNGRVPNTSAMWEHSGPVSELRKYEEPLPWSEDLDPFVEEIQRAHDNAFFTHRFIGDYKDAMADVAANNGLTVPEEVHYAG